MGPVVILVPVLDRPANVAPLLASVEEGTPEPHRVLFVVDDYDEAEREALDAAGAEYVTHVGHGTYAKKINLGARCSTEPLIFTGADDLRFHPGWLPAATAHLSETIHVVGTNDLGNPRTIAGLHSTHSLVTRAYIDDPGGVAGAGPGLVMFEGYPHDYCDDEFVGTARSRHAFAHATDSYVEHLHYTWGKGEFDATYERGRVGSREGRAIFHQRRHLWV